METENVSDRSKNISVSTGLQNVMDRYGTDQKAIRYNGNIVQGYGFLKNMTFVLIRKEKKKKRKIIYLKHLTGKLPVAPEEPSVDYT